MRGRTLFLSFAILLIGAGIGIKTFQAEIGTTIFKRAATQRVGKDITLGLPDGLHVALCGTGSPLPNPDRAGACTAIIAGKHIFVVDAGEGGARNIALMGLPTARIERLFLTHFHSDHIDGLGPMTRSLPGSIRPTLPTMATAPHIMVTLLFRLLLRVRWLYRSH